MATVAQHSPSFSAFSPLLQEQALRHWQRLLALAPQYDALPEPTRQTLLTLLGLSDFVADSLIKQPGLLAETLASDALTRAERWPAYEPELAALLAEVADEEALKRILRQFRRSRMLVIAWRELLGESEVEESFIHLTKLADALICGARDWLYAKQCSELGTPMDGDGNPQPLLILGMGKLGGGELNFSSDIDLIFTFPENGYTVGGRRELANQQFFIKLGQRLINALHQPTQDGQVFRVDMRLRPFGDAGPLAISFAAMEDYYQHHGRNWERYAMVKARVLGPQCEHATALTELLRPFVFRRYIDFGVIDGLRQMKAMIAAEVRRKGLEGNIKLGAGGIREVEFIAQALQLIRGGREPALRVRHLPEALAAIAQGAPWRGASANACSPPIASCAGWKTSCRRSAISRPRLCPPRIGIASGSSPPSALPTGTPSWPTSMRRWPPSIRSSSPWWGKRRRPPPTWNSSGSISGAPSLMPPSWKNC